jgi:hypothetical protein
MNFPRIILVLAIASVIGIAWSLVLPFPFSLVASVISGAFIGHYGFDYVTNKRDQHHQ